MSIFCKIANKEIPSCCIYEDELCMAFLDLAQVTKGHTLIIPKQHVDNLLTCDEALAAHLMKVATKLAKHLQVKLQAQGMNLLSNAQEVAGQTVMHFHLHLIPRYSEQDAICIQFNESEKQDLDALCALLKE